MPEPAQTARLLVGAWPVGPAAALLRNTALRTITGLDYPVSM